MIAEHTIILYIHCSTNSEWKVQTLTGRASFVAGLPKATVNVIVSQTRTDLMFAELVQNPFTGLNSVEINSGRRILRKFCDHRVSYNMIRRVVE